MATIFESLTDAQIEALLAELEAQQAAETILAGQAPEAALPEVVAPEVLAVEAATGTTGGQVATDLGQIPANRDVNVIGADGGLFTGGLAKPGPGDVLRDPLVVTTGTTGTEPGIEQPGVTYPGSGQPIFAGGGAGALGGLTPNIPTGTLGGGIFGGGTQAPELTGATPGISPGTGIGGDTGGPTATVNVGGTPRTVVFDDIIRGEINKEIALLGREGIASNDERYGTRIMDAANRGVAIYEAQTAPARDVSVTPGSGTATPQGGIPLILPIPGLDPTTAAILTAAGLIFSGGKIARLNPQNPVGSVVGAVQGIGQTGQNVINVATGKDTLGNIWDPGSTGAPSGSTGAGTGATGGAGGDVGGGTAGNVGGAIFGGGLSTGGGAGAAATGATAGMGQQTTGGGAVAVTPGSLGGNTTSTSQVSIRQEGTASNEPIIAQTQSDWGQVVGTGPANVATKAEDIKAGPPVAINSGIATAPDYIVKQTPAVDLEPNVPQKPPVAIKSDVATATDYTVKQTPAVDMEPDVKTTPVTPTGSTTPTSTSTAATPIVINAPTVGYTLPQAGTPAARNLYTEAGTTLSSLASPMQRFQIGVDASGQPIYGTIPQTGGRPSTLSEAIAQGYGGLAGGMREADVQNLFGAIGAATGRTPTAGTGYQSELNRAAAEQTAAANAALRMGNIMDAELLSARAQALRQQANPELFGAGGALPQYTQQAREQAMRDVAALRSAEAGQLTPEQIRNAQQAAREAYAARGQVFSEGAKAQEVLNRQQAIQQQQQIARQNLAQSMGQLGQGVAYQTANIFDPMAATLGAQYGMQSQNVGMNQALYNQAMGLTSGAGGYGFAQQMINPFTGYAQDVYGTNVNALNAAQIAAANRQAALEAAKMGQTGTYAQAAGNLIASGGLGQIQSGITGGIQGLLSLLGGKWPTS